MSEEQEKITPCECPVAGYCARHKIRKNAHFHKLCSTRMDYFDMYEKCAGPGQEFTNCENDEVVNPITIEEPKPLKSAKEVVNEPKKGDGIKMPSLWEQAKSFAKATKEHVASGLSNVTVEEQEVRLKICSDCEWFKERENRCGKCGCPLARKSLWKTSDCPIGKWPKL